MDNEEVAVRQKMADAKSSLTNKLEALEETVVDTVGKVTEPVAETAEAVKDTVASVKESVEEAAEMVKDTVQEGMASVRRLLDFTGNVKRHPWLMVAGSVGAGMCLEMVLSSGSRTEPKRNAPSRSSQARSESEGSDSGQNHSSGSGIMSWLAQLGPDMSKLKSMAVSQILGMVRGMVVKAVPQQMQNGLREFFDSAAKKLGGEPEAEQPQQANTSQQPEGERNGNNAKRKPAEVGRSMGPTRWSS